MPKRAWNKNNKLFFMNNMNEIRSKKNHFCIYSHLVHDNSRIFYCVDNTTTLQWNIYDKINGFFHSLNLLKAIKMNAIGDLIPFSDRFIVTLRLVIWKVLVSKQCVDNALSYSWFKHYTLLMAIKKTAVYKIKRKRSNDVVHVESNTSKSENHFHRFASVASIWCGGCLEAHQTNS